MQSKVSCGIDKEAEVRNCTFVKTVLMLLVVFYHSILFWGGEWLAEEPVFFAEPLGVLAAWLNTVHIQGFVLVSGYIFSFAKLEQGKYTKFAPFVKNKAKRLLIPYLFVAAVWVIPIQSVFFELDAVTIIKNYMFAAAPSQLWFLIMLFVVFMLVYPLAGFFAAHTWKGLIAVLGIYAVGLVGGSLLPNVFQIWTAMKYIPLFYLGFKLRQYGSQGIRKVPGYLWLAVSVALFALLQYLNGYDMIVLKMIRLGITFVLNIVGAIMAFVILQKLADKVRWNRPGFLFVSKRSMTVYLLHQQIIYFCVYYLNGVVNPYIHALINFVVSVTVSLLIATILMKFPVTRFLIGEK